VAVKPRVTDTVTLSILDWDNVIDRTSLGFDQLKPPGLAEVAVLGADGQPIAPADPLGNRDRTVTLGCGRGPIIALAGRFIQTSISTTVGALLAGAPIAAQPCDRDPIALPAGQQELLISPGAAFVVDGAQLTGPLAGTVAGAGTVPAQTGQWDSSRREVLVEPSSSTRALVVPESVNPGWTARTADGTRLRPITVNGWQQGWVVPAGVAGPITLTFGSTTLYRLGLFGGLALLPVLALLALPCRRRRPAASRAGPAPRSWRPGPVSGSVAVLAAGAVISGVPGIVVIAAALGLRHLLRARPALCDAVTVGSTAGGLILSGALLSRHPWRSVQGYAGHSPGVQLLALIAVGVLAASAVTVTALSSGARRGWRYSQRRSATRAGASTSE
jgi:arabinofuranan 3-O-arabinosyltransferase